MSYLALARKWRPRTFSQLIGQDHVSKALINSLNQQRLHHAYLFTGTRGVGKTSVARLLAKALNCEKGISALPCLQCEACTAIEQGRFVDLIEIDAASKTRVEDTRELLENVQYATNTGRFKIYLIDEVHMLSQHSFNALLKTLEEPPEHVKFLLATTDPQKLPITVLSRCLQFNLKHLVPEVIFQQLQTIMTEENRPFSEEALFIIAKAAQGSMRDALSILDQILVSTDDSITVQDVKSALGYTQQDFALQLLQALAAQDGANVVALSRQIALEGGHFSYVLDEIIQYLHQMTLYHVLPSDNLLLCGIPEIQTLATHISAEDAQLFYQIALKGSQDMALAPVLALGFEMTLLRMLSFGLVTNNTPPPPKKRLSDNNPKTTIAIETPQSSQLSVHETKPRAKPTTVRSAPEEAEQPPEIDMLVDMLEPQDTSPASTEPFTNTAEFETNSMNWETLLPKLGLTGMARNAADNATLIETTNKEVILGVPPGYQSLFTNAVVQRIQDALCNQTQQKIKLSLRIEPANQSSPAQKKQEALQLRQETATNNLKEDSFLQELEQTFSAQIIKNSISHPKDEL